MLAVGDWLNNRVGRIQVIALDGKRCRFRYDDGKEGEADIDLLLRIDSILKKEVQERPNHATASSVAPVLKALFKKPERSNHRQCHRCNKSLESVPEIYVQNQLYCYSCAKIAYEAECNAKQKLKFNRTLLRHETESENQDVNMDERVRSAFSKLNDFRRLNGLHGNPEKITKIILEIPFALLSIVTWPILGFVDWNPWSKDDRMQKIDQLFGEKFPNENSWIEKYKKEQADKEAETLRKRRADEEYILSPVSLRIHDSCNPMDTTATGYVRKSIVFRDQLRCKWCGTRDVEFEVHHVKPRANGGTDNTKNLITLCIPCHKKEDWFGHVHMKRDS